MAIRLKHVLLVLLLLGGVIGCGPHYGYRHYDRDWYGRPPYYSHNPGWNGPWYGRPWPWHSYGPYRRYGRWHDHDHDHD
jgi:hypothetical protein